MQCGGQQVKQKPVFGAVPRALVGDNGPSVIPSEDPSVFGTAALICDTPVEARSFFSAQLVYSVGRLGLDDTGGIRVAWRMISDSGRPQMTDARAANYVTARSDGEGRLELSYDLNGGQRPWNEVLTIRQRGGYLSEGNRITITFGDTSGGSPGMLAQSFAEGGREFRVMADVQATGNFTELPGHQLSIPIVAGPAARYRAVLPSLRRPGETFHLGIKAEDIWGNPTAQAQARLRLEPSLPVNGLPEVLDYAPEDRALSIEGLSVDAEGVLRIRVLTADGVMLAEAGPLVIRQGDHAGFWGDLHGQSGETVGVTTVESYFDFARNKAFLDVASHQANDFQINAAFWAHLNQLTARINEPGRFTVLPGYEWSGNTAVGGDHNVFFREEGRPIRRCSHALLEDRSDIASDANTLTDLFTAFRQTGEDVVMYAHVGGRYANIHYDHDPLIETAVEVHSAWGTFPWILTDGFALGRRVGVVANSDGHKGRPGASYPGESVFGAYGGLTCFLTDQNDRAGIFEAQRRRHHYATSGCRMHIDLSVSLPEEGRLYTRNPDALPDAPSQPAERAMMGDIIRTGARQAKLSVELTAHAGIERVEVFRGAERLQIRRPYTAEELGKRLRVLWSGAEYRGRGRDTHWRGRAQLREAEISRFETINQWNPNALLEQRGSDTVIWHSVTTGNFAGFDLWVEGAEGQLGIATNLCNLDIGMPDIGMADIVVDAGGLDRMLRVFRLPDDPLPRSFSFTEEIELLAEGDTPVWICVTTEDGFQAWTSPVYLIR